MEDLGEDVDSGAAVSPLQTALMHMPSLLRLMNMSNADYDEVHKDTKNNKLHIFLRLKESDLHAALPKTVDGLRSCFQFTWIQQASVNFTADLLFDGMLSCRYCTGSDSRSDLQCKISVLRSHENSTTAAGKPSKHSKNVERAVAASRTLAADRAAAKQSRGDLSGLRQRDLGEVGVTPLAAGIPLRDQAMPMVAALAVSQGVPYSSVPAMYDQRILTLVRESTNGCVKSRSLRETELPHMRGLVHERLKRKVATRVPLSVFVDGGNTPGLLGGEKILAVCIGGAGLDCDALVKVKFLGSRHENTESQARAIHESLTELGATVAQTRFICSDNAAVNKASVNYLNAHYGWNVEWRRCLPHCINLVCVELTQPFEDEYDIMAFLTKARGMFNAGGGASKKHRLIEAGVRLCKLDFTPTRWGTALQANTYLCSLQSKDDLNAARASLELTRKHDLEELQLARESTRADSQKRVPSLEQALKATEDALAAPDVPQPIWCALYEVIEELKGEQAKELDQLKRMRKANADALAKGAKPPADFDVCG
jgi:hypothetical protein